MQTQISDKFRNNPQIADAESILRACVHCGFCTATCPTYQILGDELDGPRGRIYLIKQVLEGNNASRETQLRLDRCLSCRSCETTCPSGVRYSRLLDIGREIVEDQVPRKMTQKVQRVLLRKIIAYPRRFAILLVVAKVLQPLLTRSFKAKILFSNRAKTVETKSQNRKILLLQGCVQSVVTPATNKATHAVLQTLGIESVSAENAGCCGALSHHLSAHEEALEFMRRNIDAWWPYVEQGVESIVVTASGCGMMVKDYGELLKSDMAYAGKAQRISELTKDLSEIISQETQLQDRLGQKPVAKPLKVAFHSPCTLQHGQQINGLVESLLEKAGFKIMPVKDAHLCCGSAGTYSVLQPDISACLLSGKLMALQYSKPDIIATANVGCQMQLASKSQVPVVHWIELLDTSSFEFGANTLMLAGR